MMKVKKKTKKHQDPIVRVFFVCWRCNSYRLLSTCLVKENAIACSFISPRHIKVLSCLMQYPEIWYSSYMQKWTIAQVELCLTLSCQTMDRAASVSTWTGDHIDRTISVFTLTDSQSHRQSCFTLYLNRKSHRQSCVSLYLDRQSRRQELRQSSPPSLHRTDQKPVLSEQSLTIMR